MTVLPHGRLAVWYFWYFAFIGAFLPYFALYLQSLGFSASRIAVLMSLGQFMRLLAPLLWQVFAALPAIEFQGGWLSLLLAGLLVGLGSRYGAGCTSGHGVCGIARLSPRSLLATLVFMASGFATVYVLRHGLGG